MLSRYSGVIAMAALVAGLMSAAAEAAGKNTFQLQSSAFAPNGNIPAKFTCEGKNVSPPLAWSGAPAKTQSYALTVEDPDAPKGTVTHWLMFNIPAKLAALPDATALPPNAKEGLNSANAKGYHGPCPPSGQHHYVFTLYALDAMLNVTQPPTKAQLEAAMKPHVLGRATLTGLYEKQTPKPPTREDIVNARASRPK